MAMIAIKFVIAHEIGHLYNGHCHYRAAINNNTSSAFMLYNKGKADIPLNELHTLEIDADAFAMCRIIDMVVNSLFSDELLLSIINNKSDIFKMLGFSMHGLFRIIGHEQDLKEGGFEKSHPPFLIRLMEITDAGRIAISKLNKDLEIDYQNFYSGLSHCEQILQELLKKEPFTEDQIANEVNIAYLERINVTWKALRLKLLPYTRTCLAE
jgi:hypothetical protein